MIFNTRVEAGRQLGARLAHLRGQDVVVVGLPRGGVPVGYEVARALDAPLDVILVRKIGVPFQPELAMGAIAEGGVRVVNEETLRLANVGPGAFAEVEAREAAELERRARRFRDGRPRIPLAGRTVVIVDDGIATGSTALAACRVVRAQGAERVVLATPVAARDRVDWLRRQADEVICVQEPASFFGIGEFYADFDQTPDEEVTDLLRRAAARRPGGATGNRDADPVEDARAEAARVEGARAENACGEAARAEGARGETARAETACGETARAEGAPAEGACDGGGPGTGRVVEVSIPADLVRLAGRLSVPPQPGGVVVFAHGSGSSRISPRNRFVADTLASAGLATLLFDLLTPDEERDVGNVFDIGLLARRLLAATAWLREVSATAALPLGYFGASTGAAAALSAAAEAAQQPAFDVAAVVSRGGRPDLAWDALPAVRAPTLLVVGGLDEQVLELNRRARERLTGCASRLEIVPGATHLFSEPGALERVAALARDWFVDHLTLLGHAHQV
ncbi:putative phosphoribosyltransferase [Frankia torreyi]|uniref:Putative phosphoribosyltransferase n=1 Tax=Frankia torreyi TaxID=1856 RepID=A0A0D8BLC1_9ACTN|nr:MULTISPECIES: phosphoribosyltransferase family protein [Frankia]KJE24916.1 putative phosphoribosyltransferase [Frankia torreyi]